MFLHRHTNQGPSLATPASRTAAGTPSLPTPETSDKMKKTPVLPILMRMPNPPFRRKNCLSEGQRALSDGSIDAARIAFHKAAAYQPNNPQITIVAAGAALRTNHPEMAVELLVPAAKHFSKSTAIYRMLGVAYYRLGDFNLPKLHCNKHFRWTSRVLYPIF